MSKKAKSRRKDAYKTFLNGMLSHREQFIARKLALIEKILQNDTLKNTIFSKKRNELSVLERAVVDSINDRELSNNTEDFATLAEGIKDVQAKSAKFKYTPKKI